ncbi:Arf1d [Monocercomonoides exilis]|uniref:Arf1d n=1 Tax=Monocercomonoides exilis TaxID=2049356 RepID=UPI00355AB4CA|nr:Arf1d [Monocercomonoides exilis]|eukprot:MONOS_7649.1-p1 / transcript=MONOS_7649.1 / gene=MONOS_7649 / organism=Monocercomonoides_exilis_PA203 / gene_product=Arf1d / transcript_product=Arf1d / location=Mono_scaffold00267:17523-18227(-) / protein_length=191 / sequence_SO=supercontig / SO=protein_coding / is_pseudo=false
MGGCCSRTVGFSKTKERKVVILGLDGSGKTSILYWYKEGTKVQTMPTDRFNYEEIGFGNIVFLMWDVCATKTIRRLWHHYYTGADGIIFVIDSTDRQRIACETMECDDCVKEVLSLVVSNQESRQVPILFYATKQDKENCLSTAEIAKSLEIDKLCEGRQWYMQPCSSATGDGIQAGLDWLTTELQEKPA